MTSSLRECKACLLAEIDKDMAANLEQRIKHIDIELKVSDDIYNERLDICKGCDKLVDGLCYACGCYVELRGVMKKNYCPYKKWLSTN